MTEYEPLAAKYRVPIVVTGFEPSIYSKASRCVSDSSRRVARGRKSIRTFRAAGRGTYPAQTLVSEVFKIVPRKWRGVGEIPESGYRPDPRIRRSLMPRSVFAVTASYCGGARGMYQRHDPSGHKEAQ